MPKDGMDVRKDVHEVGVDCYLDRFSQRQCQIKLGSVEKCLNLGLLANTGCGHQMVLLNFGENASSFVPLVISSHKIREQKAQMEET